MSYATPSLPTGLVPRFALFIAGLQRAMGEVMLWRRDTTPLAMLLLDYLSDVRRRLAALHARFAAGTLPRRRATLRPAAARAAPERPSGEHRPPGIPAGPVLLTVFQAGYDEQLQALLDDPEMRALLAASPRAGRLLRPLWRKLSPRPLPAVLRLPARAPRAKRPRVVAAEAAGANPSPRPLVCSSQSKPTRGEGETGRPAWWTYPVSLWPDPPGAAPAGPEPPLPDGLPSFCDG